MIWEVNYRNQKMDLINSREMKTLLGCLVQLRIKINSMDLTNTHKIVKPIISSPMTILTTI
jgi:hypothetical protein